VPRDRGDLVLTDVERRVALRGLGGLRALSEEALAGLARLAQRRHWAAGARLEAHGVPLLLDGDWQAADDSSSVAEQVELAWLARAPLPELTTAAGAVILDVPRARLDDALDECFPAWLATTRALAARLVHRGVTDAPLVAGEPDAPPPLSARLVALARALPFARAHVDALLQLDEAAEEVRLAPGAPAWRAGEAARSLLVPLGPDGGERLVGVGGLELLAQRPRAARLEPARPLVALRVDGERLLDVIEDHHRLARDLLAALAGALPALH
jgi:hypothetical protein